MDKETLARAKKLEELRAMGRDPYDKMWDEFYELADAAKLNDRVYQTLCDLVQKGGPA